MSKSLDREQYAQRVAPSQSQNLLCSSSWLWLQHNTIQGHNGPVKISIDRCRATSQGPLLSVPACPDYQHKMAKIVAVRRRLRLLSMPTPFRMRRARLVRRAGVRILETSDAPLPPCRSRHHVKERILSRPFPPHAAHCIKRESDLWSSMSCHADTGEIEKEHCP